MRVKVTTQIDSELKELFEITKHKHGKTYSDVLETGIRNLLFKIKPFTMLADEIEEFYYQIGARVDYFWKIKKMQLEGTENQELKEQIEQEFEEMRKTVFEHIENQISSQLEAGTIDWDFYSNLLFFDTVDECKEWVLKKLNT